MSRRAALKALGRVTSLVKLPSARAATESLCCFWTASAQIGGQIVSRDAKKLKVINNQLIRRYFRLTPPPPNEKGPRIRALHISVTESRGSVRL